MMNIPFDPVFYERSLWSSLFMNAPLDPVYNDE